MICTVFLRHLLLHRLFDLFLVFLLSLIGEFLLMDVFPAGVAEYRCEVPRDPHSREEDLRADLARHRDLVDMADVPNLGWDTLDALTTMSFFCSVRWQKLKKGQPLLHSPLSVRCLYSLPAYNAVQSAWCQAKQR